MQRVYYSSRIIALRTRYEDYTLTHKSKSLSVSNKKTKFKKYTNAITQQSLA